jgi:hypothetical protein
MKITKSQLKQIIKEELEAVLSEGPEIVSYPDEEGVRMRRMDPEDRGRRKTLWGGMHQGDMTPEEEWRWKTGLKIKNTGYNHGLNNQPWGGRMGTGWDPGQFASEYDEGYEEGLEDSRKGESWLTPYEQGLESDNLDVSLGGQEVASTSAGIGTRMGPYKSRHRAMPPEEKMRQATSKYAGIDPSATGDDAMNDPRNPAYAYPKKRRK